MSIPARGNEMGFHEWREEYPNRTRHYVNGTQTRDTTEMSIKPVHQTWKSGHGNPLVPIPGSTTMWRPPSNYSRTVVDISYKSGSWADHDGDHLDLYEGIAWWDENHNRQAPWEAFYWNGPIVSWANHLESESVAKALAYMKDQKVGFGEDASTLNQTYSMVVENGKTLLSAALALKRGNLPAVWSILKDGRSAVRRGADYYLQYKFGWKPLMTDIYDGWNLFKQQSQSAFIVSSHAKSKREEIVPYGYDPNAEVTGKGYRQAYTKLYGLVDPTKTRLGDTIGLSNPLSIGWELVPWSFVVDWFVPVGKTLDSLTGPAGVTFLGGFTTMKGEYECTSSWSPKGRWDSGTPLVNHRKGHSIDRRVYSNWPKAGFYFVDPFTAKSSTKSAHGESAIALLLQKLLR